MIRVLHLFSVNPEFQVEHGISLLTDPAAGAFQAATSTIGCGGNFRSALAAAATLRFSHAGLDLIHAWDPPAFIAAVASGLPVVFSPTARVKRGSWSWLATAAYPEVYVVSQTNWACQQQIRAGLPAHRCHTIVPGFGSPQTSGTSNPNLRARLGISPGDFVILAPGESSRPARHRTAWHASAILRVLDPRFRLLLWGRGPQARLVCELSAKVKQSDLLIEPQRILGRDVSFEELPALADAVLFTGSSDASLVPLAACAASGLPTVATDSAALRETFGRGTLITVPPKDVRTLAQRLLELRDNPQLGADFGATARDKAAQLFSPRRFVDQFSQLYNCIVERHHQIHGPAIPQSQPSQHDPAVAGARL